jgi:predicted outer membrane repeat protein
VFSKPGFEYILQLNDCDSSTRVDGFVLQQASKSAIRVRNGCPRIVNCRFRNNTGLTGAAIYADGVTRIRIEYCVFGANTCSVDGGAVFITNCAADPYGWGPIIAQSQFYNNSAGAGGGGLKISNCPTIPQVTNCVFNGNSAVEGGAIATEATYIYIVNSTFYTNVATNPISSASGHTLDINGGNLLNSIIWNGELGPTSKHVVNHGRAMPVDTSTIKATANLIEADFVYGFYQTNPLFVNETSVAGADGLFGTDDDGLRLTSSSIGIDAGFIDLFVNHRQTDALGNPRLVGRKVDLGAYESQRSGRLTPPEVIKGMRTGSYTFYFRHTKTDWGQKDPGPSPQCFPGRNLIYEGREQAREIGKAQRYLGIPIGEVESSPVCRCWETADLMTGRYNKNQLWASGGTGNVNARRDSVLSTPPVGGNRVITSHDAVANAVFNADGAGTELTSAELMEGDVLVVQPLADTFKIVAQWCSDTWERYHVRFPEASTDVWEGAQADAGLLVCYPNPATDMFTVSAERPTAARVVNMMGQVVWQGTLEDAIILRVTDWPSGSYRVCTDGRSIPVSVLH